MIHEFKIFNRSGIVIPVDLVYPIDLYKNCDDKDYSSFFDGSSKGISWKKDTSKIIISDEAVDVKGLPTIDFQYVVAIYQEANGQYCPPSNAVIYNLDGSIHKVLSVPPFISDRLIKRIAENGDSNPPTKLPHPELIPVFKGFSWDKDKYGNIFNYISIAYDRDYGEGRKLNPETGEIGELVDDWYEYH